MPLTLDAVRKVLSDHLAGDPAGRWRMDASLAEVAQFAFDAGMAEVSASDPDKGVVRVLRLHAIRECRDALIPDTHSWRVLNEKLEAEYAKS